MIHKFITMIKNAFKNLDKMALYILKKGLSFCFLLSTFSAIVLLAYECFALNPIIFQVGLILFKASITFAISFVICAIASDTIKKQII